MLGLRHADGRWDLFAEGRGGSCAASGIEEWREIGSAEECPWWEAYRYGDTAKGRCGCRHGGSAPAARTVCVASPLVVGGIVWGILLCEYDPDAGTDEFLLVSMVRSFAGVIAESLRSRPAILRRDFDPRGRVFRRTATTGISPDAAFLRRLLDLACGACGADSGGLALLGPGMTEIMVVAEYRIGSWILGLKVPLENSHAGRAFRVGEAIALSGEEIRGSSGRIAGRPLEATAGVLVPLHEGDRIEGLILLLRRARDESDADFSDLQMRSIRTIGRLLSLLLARQWNVREREEQLQLQRRLVEASGAVAWNRFDANLDLVLKHVTEIVCTDSTVVLLRPRDDPGVLEVIATTYTPELVGMRMPLDRSLIWKGVCEGNVSIFGAEQIYARGYERLVNLGRKVAGRIEDILCMPIFMRGEVEGAFVLVHREGSVERFHAGHVEALQPIVEQVSAFLANSRLVDDLDENRRRLRVLLRETHHRIKNSLQMLSSMIDLEESRAGKEGRPVQLGPIRDRIRSVARIHEIFSQEAEDRVPLGTILGEVAREVWGSGEIEIDVGSGADRMLTSETAVSTALIAHELSLNALKHGERGTFRVRAGETGGFCVVSFENGVSPGGEPPGGGKTGLRLVRAIAEHDLGGTVEWGISGEKFRATLKFPCTGEKGDKKG